jgi:hypothetical protein
MPLRPCLTWGELVRSGSYCPSHDPRAQRYRQKRGSGWQASQFRAKVLARSGGRCERCGSGERVEAHHELPAAVYGPDDPAAGVALCARCHRAARQLG